MFYGSSPSSPTIVKIRRYPPTDSFIGSWWAARGGIRYWLTQPWIKLGPCQWIIVRAEPCRLAVLFSPSRQHSENQCCPSNPEKEGSANRGAWKLYATKRENPSNCSGTRLGGDLILEAPKRKRTVSHGKRQYFGTIPIILEQKKKGLLLTLCFQIEQRQNGICFISEAWSHLHTASNCTAKRNLHTISRRAERAHDLCSSLEREYSGDQRRALVPPKNADKRVGFSPWPNEKGKKQSSSDRRRHIFDATVWKSDKPKIAMAGHQRKPTRKTAASTRDRLESLLCLASTWWEASKGKEEKPDHSVLWVATIDNARAERYNGKQGQRYLMSRCESLQCMWLFGSSPTPLLRCTLIVSSERMEQNTMLAHITCPQVV